MEKSLEKPLLAPADRLHAALREIGLTDNEILIYSISLREGPLTIAKLAELAGLQRPNVYKIILELEGRGLANFSERKSRSKSFVVEPPTVIREILEKRAHALNEAKQSLLSDLPQLLALYSQGSRDTKIRIYKYRNEWTNLFFQSLDEADGQILWFGEYDSWLQFISRESEEEWINKRIKRKIAIKLLLLPSKTTTDFKRSEPEIFREFKTVESGLPFDCSFQIYGNKIIIWQPSSPLILLIEDEHIVKMFKAVFFIMWHKA